MTAIKNVTTKITNKSEIQVKIQYSFIYNSKYNDYILGEDLNPGETSKDFDANPGTDHSCVWKVLIFQYGMPFLQAYLKHQPKAGECVEVELYDTFARIGEKVTASYKRIDNNKLPTTEPEQTQIEVVGDQGYIYCALKGLDPNNTCIVPVVDTGTDLSFRLEFGGGDNREIGFTVKDPHGTVYSSSNDGADDIWATSAAGKDDVLQTFYIKNPTQGNWTATIYSNATDWVLIGSTNSDGASSVSDAAFNALPPATKEDLYQTISFDDGSIPPEVCYACQAQALAIMGLAAATFYFWAGPVTATSAVVLYAERLLGGNVAGYVSTINDLYDYWQKGTTSWNLARSFCELEGMCTISD